MKRTLTAEDLDLVYFRTQDAEGRWHSVNALEATDEQFDAWAHSRIDIAEDTCNHEWEAQERAYFCDYLWQHDELYLLKREAFSSNSDARPTPPAESGDGSTASPKTE